MNRVTFYPHNISVAVKKRTSLLEAAASAGITMNNVCGGEGICGRCLMRVKEGRVTGGTSGKLSAEQVKQGFVLACQAHIESDCFIEIPDQALAKEKKGADADAQRFRDFDDIFHEGKCSPHPLVQKVFLKLTRPSLTDALPDHQRVCAAIEKQLSVRQVQAGLEIIRMLPAVLREHEYCVTATVAMRGPVMEIIDIEGGAAEGRNYMVVVDIGTTTVVAHLVDAHAYKTVDAEACFNSQGMYGREVTGRLISAEKRGGDILAKRIIDDINRLIHALAERNTIRLDDITAIVCAGNTAMQHFLLGLPTQHIRRSPFVATSVNPPAVRAAEIGLQIHPRGLLYSLPGIGSWVGSDLTAGILATGIHEKEEISMLIDIGTNGEVIVGNREWIMACSASAGPALEGASVECGVRAGNGAIEKVYAEQDAIRYRTIGGEAAHGICGSGIIDLISTLLAEKIINRKGRFAARSSERIEAYKEVKRFVLVDKKESAHGKSVYITEADIENVITAKAAIYAAMKILLKRLDLHFTDIRNFYVAGAFGNFIDIDSAVSIGLLPEIPRDRVQFVGNTSVKGATLAALCRDALDTIAEIGVKTTYYDLMGADDYVQEFKKAMFLPHTDIEEFSQT